MRAVITKSMYRELTDEVKNQSFLLNIFWSGLLVYAVSNALPKPQFISYKIGQAIEVMGIVLMVIPAVQLIRFKIENRYLKILFVLYCLWLSSIILRDLTFPVSYDFIKTFLFGGGNGGLMYLVPLLLLFPKNFAFYKKIFDILVLFGIAYLLLDVVFLKQLLFSGNNIISQGIVENLSELSIPVGFILLTYPYHSSKRLLYSLGILMVTLLFTVIRARRGLIFITSSVLLCSYLLYFFGSRKKYLIVYFSILVISLGALYATGIYRINNNKIFQFLADRGTEDTRTGVELYFYDDMKPVDWVIGRGIMGEYFCPDIEEDQVTNFRGVIETGYLQIILKGGLISLGLLLLIAIPATIKGLFFSRNTLSKAAGVWIFLFIIDLYPQNAVSFDISYILVWISIGICYSQKIRQMTNEQINTEMHAL